MRASPARDPRPRLSPTWDVRPPGLVAWWVPPQPYLLDPSAVSRSAARQRITRYRRQKWLSSGTSAEILQVCRSGPLPGCPAPSSSFPAPGTAVKCSLYLALGSQGRPNVKTRLTRFFCSLMWLSTALELGVPHTLWSSDLSQASFLFFKLGFFFLNVQQIVPVTMKCLPITYLTLFPK